MLEKDGVKWKISQERRDDERRKILEVEERKARARGKKEE